jgi:long-subunit fatty acid transport protein
MRRVRAGAWLLGLVSGTAIAGGVERSTQSVAILFEQGRYLEVSLSSFSPDVSGSLLGPVAIFPAGSASGDMAGRYSSLSVSYKQPLSEQVDLAVIIDEPIGAKVRYPGPFGVYPYPLAGSTADLTSNAITGLVRYKLPSSFSVHGGLRYQTVKGVASLPFVGAPGPGYTVTTNNDREFGYVVGAAWEKPEIAARVALTYNSAITHDLQSTEGGPIAGVGSFETEVPKSVNLEFQTGIAKDTLLFGSIRWVEWSAFRIDPPGYPPATPLVSYPKDRTTYNLGIGRRFSENWSGAISLGYEASDGEITTNLTPTDGSTSVGLAATYTIDDVKITAGVRRVKIGDAVTSIGANFTGNSGIGFGIRIGYRF